MRTKSRKIATVVYFAMPSLLVNSVFLVGFLFSSFETLVAFVYITTAVSIIIYFIFNPCSFKVLVRGLMLSPLFLFIYATWGLLVDIIWLADDDFIAWPFNYIFSVACLIYYALPFISVSYAVRGIIAKVKSLK